MAKKKKKPKKKKKKTTKINQALKTFQYPGQ